MEDLKIQADVKRPRVEVHLVDFDQLHLQEVIDHLESSINRRYVFIKKLIESSQHKMMKEIFKGVQEWSNENSGWRTLAIVEFGEILL